MSRYEKLTEQIVKLYHQYAKELGITVSDENLMLLPTEAAIGGTIKFNSHVIWLPNFYLNYDEQQVRLAVLRSIVNYIEIVEDAQWKL